MKLVAVIFIIFLAKSVTEWKKIPNFLGLRKNLFRGARHGVFKILCMLVLSNLVSFFDFLLLIYFLQLCFMLLAYQKRFLSKLQYRYFLWDQIKMSLRYFWKFQWKSVQYLVPFELKHKLNGKKIPKLFCLTLFF